MDFTAFDGDDLPMIWGNLFQWQYEQSESIIDSNCNSNGTYTIPDTDTLLDSIPDFITNNYNYDSDGDGTNDTYYVGENLVRVDPAYSGDLTVQAGTVSILASAMEGCADLDEVSIPDSVEWIGVRAFANSGVTAVNLPEGLLTDGSQTIQMQTFYNCENLETVTFPDDGELKLVEFLAFFGCESLEGFDFTQVEVVGSLSFAKAFETGAEIDLSNTSISGNLGVFSHSGVGSVTFESESNTIGTEMFYHCESLTEINGFEHVQMLYAWAFEGCTALTQDVMADAGSLSLSSAYRAFANTGMTEVTIPASITTMTGAVFAGNEQLDTVNWYSSVSHSFFSAFNDCAKYGVSNYCWTQFSMPGETTASEYTFPTTLNLYALPSSPLFYDQPYLETVNFYCEVTSIPDQAFQYCPNLETVTFAYPEKLESIGNNAFLGCLSLHSFPFTDLTELTSIGGNVFLLTNGTIDTSTGYGLTEIDLSQCTKLNQTNSIGVAAFYCQYSATSLHLPAGYCSTAIGVFNYTVSMKEFICESDLDISFMKNMIFTGDSSGRNYNLETITITGDLTYTNTYDAAFFHGMTNLKTVNLPNATSIPANCFWGCSVLETVYAPKATAVGDYAFWGAGITEAVISADVTYGDYVFQNCTKLETVVVEEGRTELGDFMFEGCTALAQVSLPSTLETINWAAFKNANACTIDIPESVDTIEDDAFSGGSFDLIFRGAPAVNLYHAEYTGYDTSNTLLPIDENATIYYATDSALTAANLYKADASLSGLTISAVPDALNMTVTGAPASVTAGQGLDLSTLVVSYNDTVLTTDQYTLDYDSTDTISGARMVTVTVTAASAITVDLMTTPIRAVALSGADVTGDVYSVVSESNLPATTFTVTVLGTTSITVNSTKHKTSYTEGDALDVSNLTILVTNVDGSTQTVAVTADMVSGFNSKSAVSRQILTITYEGQTAIYIIEIEDDGPRKTYDTSDESDEETTTTETLDDGTVITTVTDEDGAIVQTIETADGVVAVIEIDEDGDVTKVEITVSKEAVAQSEQTGEPVTLPVEVSAASSTKKAISIEVEVPTGGATVEILVDDVTASTVVIIVNDDGTETVVKTTKTTENGVVFTLDDDATVKIVDNSKQFSDVHDVNHWSTTAVDFVTARGLFNGMSDTTFAPDAPMTRGMLAMVLYNLEGNPAYSTLAGFADVTADTWYHDAVNWAAELGILSGYSDSDFGATDNITREQLAVALWRYAGCPQSSNSLDSFADADQISDYAKEALAWASEYGIVNGYGDGNLGAKDPATRGQVAQMLMNFIQNV